jgi:hypothetical protein
VEQINSRRAEQEMALELHILQLNSTPMLLQFLAVEEHKSEMANIFEGMMAYNTASIQSTPLGAIFAFNG